MFKKTHKQRIQNVLNEEAKLIKKIESLIDEFYKENDKASLISVIETIINIGNPKHHQFLTNFKDDYMNGALTLKDIKHFEDLYETYIIKRND